MNRHQQQGLFCHLFHYDYCAAASARNLQYLYMTTGTTSLQQTQLYYSNNLLLCHNRGALSIGRRDQTKYGEWCGGCPIGCVLVDRKAQHRGKKEQQLRRTSLDQLLLQHKCTVMGKMNRNDLTLPFFSLQRPSSLRGPPD